MNSILKKALIITTIISIVIFGLSIVINSTNKFKDSNSESEFYLQRYCEFKGYDNFTYSNIGHQYYCNGKNNSYFVITDFDDYYVFRDIFQKALEESYNEMKLKEK